MIPLFLVPLPRGASLPGYAPAEEGLAVKAEAWVRAKGAGVLGVWKDSKEGGAVDGVDATKFTHEFELLDSLLRVLTHRRFNFQSQKNIHPDLIPQARERLQMQLQEGKPLAFYLLFNGGYRSWPFSEEPALTFTPDATEWMLLHQISMFQKQIKALYPPGIQFTIVVNNGVAHWVNEISIAKTAKYAEQLRDMIKTWGAEAGIRVLLQSERPSFNPLFQEFGTIPERELWPKEHELVERFLGRRCSKEEALYRATRYVRAEEYWGEEIATLAQAENAVMLRQVAHPETLSFRPFPGAAIRTQNGSFGWWLNGNQFTPKLITPENKGQFKIQWTAIDSIPGYET
jgi:hypothetical protein